MYKHGSDKSLLYNHHTYTCFYDSLFSDIRFDHVSIFELGIGSKNADITSNMTCFHHSKPLSHLGWRAFFPNSICIQGADIDPDVIVQKYKIKHISYRPNR